MLRSTILIFLVYVSVANLLYAQFDFRNRAISAGWARHQFYDQGSTAIRTKGTGWMLGGSLTRSTASHFRSWDILFSNFENAKPVKPVPANTRYPITASFGEISFRYHAAIRSWSNTSTFLAGGSVRVPWAVREWNGTNNATSFLASIPSLSASLHYRYILRSGDRPLLFETMVDWALLGYTVTSSYSGLITGATAGEVIRQQGSWTSVSKRLALTTHLLLRFSSARRLHKLGYRWDFDRYRSRSFESSYGHHIIYFSFMINRIKTNP